MPLSPICRPAPHRALDATHFATLEHAVPQAFVQSLRLPVGCRRPLVNHSADEDRKVGALEALAECFYWQLVSVHPLNVAIRGTFSHRHRLGRPALLFPLVEVQVCAGPGS